MKTKYIICSIVIFLMTTSCEEFVAIDPPLSELSRSTVFMDEVTATAAVAAIYSNMVSGLTVANGSVASISYLAALSSDEILTVTFNTETDQFSRNSLLAANRNINQLWSEPFKNIYRANAVIEGLDQTEGVSESVKSSLTGEALFIRAFNYFYLVNLFGDVPLILTTDYKANSNIARTPSVDVYAQIVKDLVESKSRLDDDYSGFADERVRATKWSATALLSRAYLYTQDWTNAEAQASAVIENSNLFGLVPLTDVFFKNSREAIWQLGNLNGNALDAVSFNFPRFRRSFLRPSLFASFETGDLRASIWVGKAPQGANTTYYATKYKNPGSVPVEYSMVLRLSEQYLIRAEARSQLNNIAGAIEDINAIRSRAGLPATSATDKPSLLSAISEERKVELFTEWGHRWLDLKRTKQADLLLGLMKIEWATDAQLYPIPVSQILACPAMRDSQNPGYE